MNENFLRSLDQADFPGRLRKLEECGFVDAFADMELNSLRHSGDVFDNWMPKLYPDQLPRAMKWLVAANTFEEAVSAGRAKVKNA